MGLAVPPLWCGEGGDGASADCLGFRGRAFGRYCLVFSGRAFGRYCLGGRG